VAPHGRQLGRAAVLSALASGPQTRAEIGDRTGLSRSAVMSLVSSLLAEGSLEELPQPPGSGRGRGRPAARIALRTSAVAVGLDLGNSHIRAATRPPGGEIDRTVARILDVGSDPARALDAAADVVAQGVAAIGHDLRDVGLVVMGVPAPVDGRTQRIAVNNILPAWVQVDPARELSRRLSVHVRVENDANLGALGERAHGGHDAESLIYVKLATGIGAGMLAEGRLVHGADGTAGEVGHVQVDPDGALCRCGARGCLETVAALPRLVDAARRIVREDLDHDTLGRLLATGHPSATRVVADAGRTIGRALADLCTLLNPRTIVVGGPSQPVNDVVADSVRATVDQFAHPMAATRLSVRSSRLGDDSAVLGALDLAETWARRRQAEGLTGEPRPAHP
jgi:predicted NBD/HSP70 family sugar kinase